MPKPRPACTQPPPATGSKILPLICQKTASRSRHVGTSINSTSISPKTIPQSRPVHASGNDVLGFSNIFSRIQPMNTHVSDLAPSAESPRPLPQKFPAAGAAPYIPVRHLRPHHGIAPPVTIRNAIPAYSAPPMPPPSQPIQVRHPTSMGIAPPVCIRQAVPAFAAPVRVEDSPAFKAPVIPPSARAENLAPASKVPVSPPVRVEVPPAFKSLISPAPVQVENPPASTAFSLTGPSIQADKPSFSRVSTIPAAVRIENPQTSKSLVTPPSSSSSPGEETAHADETKLLESSVSEDLKGLKV